MFESALLAAGVLSGAVASVAGFGIGSILTPLLSLKLDVKVAVACAAVPHFLGTALRFVLIREHLDRRVFVRFGLASAAGGLLGAILHARFGAPALTYLFGGVLCLSGVTGLFGLSERVRLEGTAAWLAGALSGALGGLVGNQGGIRSAAMLGFDVPKEAFVATATAVGLLVDGARLPVYLAAEGGAVLRAWPLLLAASAGVIVGTLAGMRLLRSIPEREFKRAVSALVLILGLVMLLRGA
ncbi:MAG: sulfite exporter TauE/SafE family protein [Elusimicrobia bacterium]|nr:sulfite exporter TauE/SafE family protein [Elusimicrobiota bacterium]